MWCLRFQPIRPMPLNFLLAGLALKLLKSSNPYEIVLYLKELTTRGRRKTSLVEPGALTHRLQNPKWPTGAQNGRQGLERGVRLGFWVLPSIFAE